MSEFLYRPRSSEPCAHCGCPLLGYATVDDKAVCHWEGWDCYRAITVYGEPIGLRLHQEFIEFADQRQVNGDAMDTATKQMLK